MSDKMNKLEILCLIGIMAAAAVLRFYGLEHIEFKADEALNLLLGIDLVEGRKFPLVGLKSSIGNYTSAMFIYLISLPLIFTRNPVYISGFIALINVAAVYGCFLLGRTLFGKRAGLIAAALFAVNPWAILYSRKIWQQDVLPFLVIGFFYSLYKGTVKRQYGCLLLSACFLAVITQVHLSTIGLIGVFLFFLWIYRDKIPFRSVAGSAVLFVLLYVPYLIFEIHSNFFNAKILLDKGMQGLSFFPEAFLIPFKLSTAVDFLPGTYVPVIDYTVGIIMAAAFLFICTQWKEPRYKLLACWFFIPMLFLASGRIDMHGDKPYFYFIQCYPVIFLAAAAVIDALITWTGRQFPRKSAVVIYGLLLAVLSYYTAVSWQFNDRLVRGDNIYWMGYGPPFSMRVKEIREIIGIARHASNRTIDAGQVQAILQRQGKTYKYDDPATDYIVKYIEH